MSNKVFQTLTEERIEHLKLAFTSSKSAFWNHEKNQLTHPGEYGLYRERAVQELLRLYTPGEFGIGTGFVITSNDLVSTQCDIIIYDKSQTPGITTESHQSFFPIESVVAVGEVKSDIRNFSELNGYLEKLAKTKSLREEVGSPTVRRSKMPNYVFKPNLHVFDHIFTFLICNKIDFNPEPIKIKYGSDIPSRFHHNLIISISDGIYNYTSMDLGSNTYYPDAEDKGRDTIAWHPKNDDTIPFHFNSFLTSYFNALNHVTLLETDMVKYLSDENY